MYDITLYDNDVFIRIPSQKLVRYHVRTCRYPSVVDRDDMHDSVGAQPYKGAALLIDFVVVFIAWLRMLICFLGS